MESPRRLTVHVDIETAPQDPDAVWITARVYDGPEPVTPTLGGASHMVPAGMVAHGAGATIREAIEVAVGADT